MTNFKGTKGKWELCKTYNEIDKPMFSITSNEGKVAFCYNLELCCGVQERSNANALLISKAPEMLEMLETCFDMLDRTKPPTEEHMKEVKTKIKQLIKEATEL